MDPSKPGSKYAALYEYLRRRPEPAVELSQAEIEAILGERLPASARRAPFWSNRHGGLQSASWLGAGFRVTHVDRRGRRIRFERASAQRVAWRAGRAGWRAETIRALRDHLGLNQAGMAEVLGVRQQTISEWETGVYVPSRSRSKHLDLVAERSGFGYRSARERGPESPIDK
jgi:hypothetical protein